MTMKAPPPGAPSSTFGGWEETAVQMDSRGVTSRRRGSPDTVRSAAVEDGHPTDASTKRGMTRLLRETVIIRWTLIVVFAVVFLTLGVIGIASYIITTQASTAVGEMRNTMHDVSNASQHLVAIGQTVESILGNERIQKAMHSLSDIFDHMDLIKMLFGSSEEGGTSLIGSLLTAERVMEILDDAQHVLALIAKIGRLETLVQPEEIEAVVAYVRQEHVLQQVASTIASLQEIMAALHGPITSGAGGEQQTRISAIVTQLVDVAAAFNTTLTNLHKSGLVIKL